MKFPCARNQIDFLELDMSSDHLLCITVSEDSNGDRRNDSSTIAISPAAAYRLAMALIQYYQRETISK